MIVKHEVRRNTYYDSVTLMLISKDIKAMNGVDEVLVGMGTGLNKELAQKLELFNGNMEGLSPNDFFITARIENPEVMEAVVLKVEELLTEKKSNLGTDYRPMTLHSALDHMPDANIVLISIPGKYAKEEAKKALDNNLNVMLFSDNVSVEDELYLKQLAVQKGLLMMGPDCGTAIINGVPLAFANVVRRGNIGVIGASGTGTQEVTVIIDKLGMGVSQVIGTGGRDLKEEIGGLMMIQAMEALIEDNDTEVIVLISKPPSLEVARKVLSMIKKTDKPVVVDFIGGNQEEIKAAGAYACITLEDAAHKAVALAKKQIPVDFEGFSMNDEEIKILIKRETNKLSPDQKYIRGLFTGGTLADEAMKMLNKVLGDIYSNIPLTPEYEIKDLNNIKGNVCIDLGDDKFTVGRPHPMIDPSTRTDRFETDIDGSVAVVLLDVVLGYGSHIDPAGELIESIKLAKEKLKKENKYLSVICSICGTANDPQDLDRSKEALEVEGVVVMPSNAQAVRFAAEIMKGV